VNKRLLFRGATKENARAFLAAKLVLSARGPIASGKGPVVLRPGHVGFQVSPRTDVLAQADILMVLH